jgi:hypothetical protein
MAIEGEKGPSASLRIKRGRGFDDFLLSSKYTI